MNKKIKLLIISNEPLSNTSSNGRTLRNFLLEIPKDQKAQFYIHGDPDKEACSNFYRISDKDALNAFFFKQKRVESPSNNSSENNKKQVNKNCFTMVIRDIVWRSYRWWKKDFDRFIEDFSPNVVLLQAGDSPFMFSIALKIAKKYKLPLIMYNSEEYVLKKKIYSSASKFSIWRQILQNRLKRVYNQFVENASCCIYNTDYLAEKYKKQYPHHKKISVLYTVSELTKIRDNSINDRFSLLYCGNLGVGRVFSLDELAKILYHIDENAVLDVYGTFPDDESKQILCSNPNVHYGGVVPYEKIPCLMSNASMLLHCENSERLEDLRGAFSTKIADSLASGRPFIVYATRKYPFVQYLERYDCAHIADNSDELELSLKKCISDVNYRNKYIQNALKVAESNHSVKQNCLIMEKILKDIL